MADGTGGEPVEYSGEYIIIGPPGTGKTTFLKRQVEKIVAAQSIIPMGTSPVLVCSLTRTAAAEIASRGLPIDRKACSTIHSHGYRSMGDPRPQLFGRDHVKEWNTLQRAYQMLGIACHEGNDLAGWSGDNEYTGGHGGACLTVATGCLHRMEPIEQWPTDVRTFYRLYTMFKRERNIIDYDDMISMAGPKPPFDAKVIIIDEAQDVSRLEWSLLRRWGRVAGALIATGDDRQSLYEWRGAYPHFLISDEVPPERRKVLSQSYRVPKAVHALAESIASQLEDKMEVAYRPTPEEGSVEYNSSRYIDIHSVVPEIEGRLAAGDSVMISCACNYMINEVAAQLTALGKLYSNPWRPSYRRWNPASMGVPGRGDQVSMQERIDALLKPSRVIHGGDRRIWTLGELAKWVFPVSTTGFMVRGARKDIYLQAAARPDDRVTDDEITRWFIRPGEFDSEVLQWFLRSDAGDESKAFSDILGWYVDRLQPALRRNWGDRITAIAKQWDKDGWDSSPKLYIGTFHSFKGAEADHVYLYPDISYSAFRVWDGLETGQLMRDPILKQFYVGVTRAKKTVSIGKASQKFEVPL